MKALFRLVVACLAALASIGAVANDGGARDGRATAYVGAVTIGGTRYLWADARRGLSIVRSSQLRFALALINRCPGVRGPFVYARTSKPRGIGFVMWAPRR